jgi:hypothetical protein
MKRDVVLVPPPARLFMALQVSCRAEFRLGIHGLANFPWTPPMRRNRAAIALGDKSNLRNPRSGTAHPRQKEMGQLPSRTEKQKRNVLLARLHGTDRGRLVTTYLALRLPSIKPASSSRPESTIVSPVTPR